MKKELHYSVRNDDNKMFYFENDYYFNLKGLKTNIPFFKRKYYILEFDGDTDGEHSCSVRDVISFNKLLKRHGCSI